MTGNWIGRLQNYKARRKFQINQQKGLVCLILINQSYVKAN